MAANFRIILNRKNDNLHLTLAGDFDGSSALELINTLKENCCNVSRVFINTRNLINIYPFGQHIFRKNLCSLSRQSGKLVFTGEKRCNIAPEE